MFQEVSFRFRVSLVALIQIVGDRIRRIHLRGILLIGGNQLGICLIDLGDLVDKRVVGRVVSVVVAVALLCQIVLRVAVVGAPAVEHEGVQVRRKDFRAVAGDVGADIERDIIVAQTVRESLRQDIRAVQRGLAGRRDIVIDLDREGDA